MGTPGVGELGSLVAMASEGLDGGDGQLRLWDTIFEKCWLERYSTYGSNLWRDATLTH